MTTAEFNYDDVITQLSLEFRDSSQDILTGQSQSLKTYADTGLPENGSGQVIQSLSRECHYIKGTAGSLGYPMVTLICQKLEDYISEIRLLAAREVGDIQSYIDRVGDILDGGTCADNEGAAIRDLPRAGGFDVDSVEYHGIDVLLIMPKGTGTTIIRRELESCGFSVNNLVDPFRALEFAVRTKPDFIVVSPVLDIFDGNELARALRAMPTTEKIPIIMISSMGKKASSLQLMPVDIPIVSKGENF